MTRDLCIFPFVSFRVRSTTLRINSGRNLINYQYKERFLVALLLETRDPKGYDEENQQIFQLRNPG